MGQVSYSCLMAVIKASARAAKVVIPKGVNEPSTALGKNNIRVKAVRLGARLKKCSSRVNASDQRTRKMAYRRSLDPEDLIQRDFKSSVWSRC